MKPLSFRALSFGIVSLLGVFASRSLPACSVPVFRYALERWPADPYELLVFHKGPLSSADRAEVERLDRARDDPRVAANLLVHKIDVAGELDGQAAAIWKAEKAERLPWVVLLYPRRLGPFGNFGPGAAPRVTSGPLTREFCRGIVDSPLRQKIADGLIAGQSAVWVFVESGDAEKDQEALKTLEVELKKMEKELQLPEILDSDLELVGLEKEDREAMKVGFSVLRLSRKDPAESVLLSMLLGSEEDLIPAEGEPPEPMTFPVFGRGRALYAVVGKGIQARVIYSACSFLVGPCSCQVKEQNPGVDLLMAVNWDELVTSSRGFDEPLPDLTGFESFITEIEPAATASEDAKEAAVEAGADDPGGDGPPAAPETVPAAPAEPPAEDVGEAIAMLVGDEYAADEGDDPASELLGDARTDYFLISSLAAIALGIAAMALVAVLLLRTKRA
ncbi:MAG: hypothetical protein O7J95_10950 [Planctomycetota bacterium]|nr:hypothetical protein [Planctomycetota bacterium]